MSDYLLMFGAFCFSMTLVGVLLTVREFRHLARKEARKRKREGA